MPPVRVRDHNLKAAVARFAVTLAILLAPWPGIGRLFPEVVGFIATAIAAPLSSDSNITFVLRSPSPQEGQPAWRGVIDVRQDFPSGTVHHAGAIDLRRVGYLQLAMFLSLAAAWPPKGWRLLRMTLITIAIVGAVIAAPVLDFLSQIEAVHLGDVLRTAISIVSRAFVAAPAMAYAIPGLVWLAASPAARAIASAGAARA
jgi:hypothetical protein